MPTISIRKVNNKLRVRASEYPTYATLHRDIRDYKPKIHFADTNYDGDTPHLYSDIAGWEVVIPYDEHGLKALKNAVTHIPDLVVNYPNLVPSVIQRLKVYQIIKPPQPTPTMSREIAAAPAAKRAAPMQSLAIKCCFFGTLCGGLLFDSKMEGASKGAIIGAMGGALLDEMQLTKKNN